MLYHLQYAKRRSGDVPAAMQICTALVAAQEETGDTDFLAAAHHAVAVIHRDYLHDPHLARQHFERALELAAIDTASREYSQISYGLAILHIRQGRLEQAEPLLTHALTIMRANNDTDGIASMLNRLSDVRPPADALAALDEALALVRKAGIRQTEAQNYEARSRLCERTGAIRESVVHMQRAAEMWESLGCPTEAAETAREVSRLKAIHRRTACGERRTKG
jgi:tetratricopeptide (TPR) repeat protein